VFATPELKEARERYALFAGLPPAEIIQEGILVETASTFYEGQEYAVRNYLSPGIAEIDLLDRLPALMHGLGRQGLEQLVACSPEDGVLVTRRSPGRVISALSFEEAKAMTQKQFKALALTIDFATRANIEIEVEPDNILFDPIEGFSLVDYSLTTDMPSTGRTIKGIGRALLWLGRGLPTFGSIESIRIREQLIPMAAQSGVSILSQSDGRALIEAAEIQKALCWSSVKNLDAELRL